MPERMGSQSRQQLWELIDKHGLQQVIDTARELVHEEAVARLAKPKHRQKATTNVEAVVKDKVPPR